MTTQALPSFDQALADQVQHTRNAQMAADHYKALVDIIREQLRKEQVLVREWTDTAGIHRATIDALTIERAALERRLAESHQGLTVAEGG